MQNDRDQVKEMLKTRIEDLCAKLLPDGRREGRLWVSYNPVTADYDRSTPETKVALTGDRGAWKDWRGGDKGDVFKLIGYIKGIDDFGEIMRWARDFLGLQHMPAAERKRLEAQMREVRRENDDRAEQTRIWKIGKAEEMFQAGNMIWARSAAEAHARAYFRARRCALGDVKNIDETTFRFSHATEYWTLGEYKNENGRRWKDKPGPNFPAVHSAVRGPAGQVTACHVTFLDPVLPQKIALPGGKPPKLIFGEAKGAVIRISHGPEGVPPEMAQTSGPLVLCEGIETGLSLAIAIPQARVWAGGSLSNMGNAPVMMDCIGSIVVARDNNFGNAQAERQLGQVLEQLERAGKPLAVMASHVGDDFNDLAKGEE